MQYGVQTGPSKKNDEFINLQDDDKETTEMASQRVSERVSGRASKRGFWVIQRSASRRAAESWEKKLTAVISRRGTA